MVHLSEKGSLKLLELKTLFKNFQVRDFCKREPPEVGHVEDGLLVGTKEVEKLLNTGQQAFVKRLESNL